MLKDAAPALLDEFVHLLNHLFAGDIPDALSMDLITAVLPGRLLCWRVQIIQVQALQLLRQHYRAGISPRSRQLRY